jgi:CheY-like chemotaxis protein
MTRNVLLVEDEPDLLLVARLMLEDSGYAVIEASGGEEAVELAEKAKVDAVFLLAARGATSYARRRAPLSAF